MAGEAYLYTDSSGTAHVVKELAQVPKRYRARAKVVAAVEEPSFKWSPERLSGPLIEMVLPIAALVFAWKRYQGFFVRASIVAFVFIWGYFALWTKISGGDLLKTDAQIQQEGGSKPESESAESSEPSEGEVIITPER